MKNVVSWLAVVCGLALVVAGWFLWGDRTQTDLFVLNVAVSSLIYAVAFVDVLVPWANFGDRAQRRVGYLGLRWFVVGGYVLSALGILIAGNCLEWSFGPMLFVQCALFVGLIFGAVAMMHGEERIVAVHGRQQDDADGIGLMRREAAALQRAAYEAPGVPERLMERLRRMNDDLRFIAPSNSDEARDVERQFVETTRAAVAMLARYEAEAERIDAALDRMERLYVRRKSIYAN